MITTALFFAQQKLFLFAATFQKKRLVKQAWHFALALGFGKHLAEEVVEYIHHNGVACEFVLRGI